MDYEKQNSRAWDVAPKDPHGDEVPGGLTRIGEKKRGKQAASARVAIHRPDSALAPTKEQSRQSHRGTRLPAIFYKRAPAGEWHSARRGRSFLKAGPAQIDAERISAAQASWRARRPPTAAIAVPLHIASGICENLASIASDLGCFLHRETYSSGNTASLGIWGEKANVQQTKENIARALGDDRGQGAGKRSFAKLQSLTPVLRDRHQKRWEQEVRRNRYRQIPPTDVAFGAIGSFHWPIAEYKPEDVLGASYEALDSIRMDLECYINYLADGNCFQVMGEAKEVQKALSRMRQTCFQLTSRSINPVRVYLQHWRSAIVPSHVFLEEYNGPRIPTVASHEEEGDEVVYSPRGEGSIEDAQELTDAHQSSLLSIERVRLTLSNALKKLHFYQGHISLVIRLGTFVLQQYKTPEHELFELIEYEDMSRESQFQGMVTEELGDAAATNDILGAIQGAHDILVPQDPMIDTLKEVRATFSAVFVFDGGTSGDLRLVKSWHETEHETTDGEAGRFQLVEDPDKWTRLDGDVGAPIQLVDMALTDLHTGGAWQFDITATRSVDNGKVPDTMINFSKNVTIDTAAALRHDEARCFVTYSPYMPLKALRQEVHYSYNIQQSDYRLDLVRFQNFAYPQGKRVSQTVAIVSEDGNEPKNVPKSAWGLSVSRADWGSDFSLNERLPVGTSAEWQDDMDYWFPSSMGDADGGFDGFKELISKLEGIEKVLRPESTGK